MAEIYDVLLSGGHVIDPKNKINSVMDVAIKDGVIAAIEPKIESEAKKNVDVNGLIVTPGLIDIHMHAYGGFDGWLFPDQHSLPHGVTTVVDTGGSGWKDFLDFKKTIIDRSQTRVLALINIVGAGMTGAPEQDVSEMDPIPCADIISQHPDDIIGSKSAHFGGPGWESAGGAIEAARLSNSIAMIDFAPQPSRTYKELLERLSPGDIHTHLYAQHIPLLDENKIVNDYVKEARSRGIIFDTGHGGGSFWFRIAVRAMEQGFPPDTISTDLHKSSRMRPNATMPATMSKFLAMGMPLNEVIFRSTQRSAEVIKRPGLGHLTVGAEADVTVLKLSEGKYGFVDSGGAKLTGSNNLDCEMTLRAGQILWDVNGRSRPEWEDLGDYKQVE